MEDLFIPYDLALELKELGFDEECFGYWWNNKDFTEPEFMLGHCKHVMEGNIKRPLYQQVFRWFREKYTLDSHIKKGKHGDYILVITNHLEDSWDEHKEAELECLKRLIEIVKENGKII